MITTPKFFFIIWFAAILISPSSHTEAVASAAVVTVKVVHSQNKYLPGDSYPVLFSLKIASPWYIHGPDKTTPELIPTTLNFSAQPSKIKIQDIRFPPPQREAFFEQSQTIELYSREIFVRAHISIDKSVDSGQYEIIGNLSYQACSSQSCLPPEKVPFKIRISVAAPATHVTVLNRKLFNHQNSFALSEKTPAAWAPGAGLWLSLLGLFLGGLALNLTPCIYPLIPITVSYFGGKGSRLKGNAYVHGGLYILGIAFTNSLLGLIASLSGGLLGSVLQNPIALFAIAGILTGLALSFFGLWELRIPAGLTRLASKNFSGYFGTFFMGLTLGIIAAPCLGPFILGLMTYVGQKGDPKLGFLYFFVLSIGMGLPLFALAIFSGTIKKLPVSGEWMVWIRKLMGWVLIGMAGHIISPLISNPVGPAVLIGIILTCAGLHLGWFDKSRGSKVFFSYLKKGAGLILIGGAIGSVAFFLPSNTNTGVSWVPYNESALRQAVLDKRPVIIDFYADWCGPCRKLDEQVFNNPEVVKLSQKFIMLRVDLTSKRPHQTELVKNYKVRGVPTVIFIDQDGREHTELRIESYVKKTAFLKKLNSLYPETDSLERGN